MHGGSQRYHQFCKEAPTYKCQYLCPHGNVTLLRKVSVQLAFIKCINILHKIFIEGTFIQSERLGKFAIHIRRILRYLDRTFFSFLSPRKLPLQLELELTCQKDKINLEAVN